MGIFDYFENASIEKRIQKAEDAANSVWKLIDKKDDFLPYDHELLEQMKIWYLRLKEKYKHDRKQSLQIATDWNDYLQNEFTSSHAAMAMGGGDEDGKLGNMIEEGSTSNFEIENRFVGLLDGKEKEWLQKYRNRN